MLLMFRCKRVEDNQVQGKGKAKVFTPKDHRETKRRKGKKEPILGFAKANKIGTF